MACNGNKQVPSSPRSRPAGREELRVYLGAAMMVGPARCVLALTLASLGQLRFGQPDEIQVGGGTGLQTQRFARRT